LLTISDNTLYQKQQKHQSSTKHNNLHVKALGISCYLHRARRCRFRIYRLRNLLG